MNIYRYLAALLVAPVLTLTQPIFAQDSAFDLDLQKLSLTVSVLKISKDTHGQAA